MRINPDASGQSQMQQTMRQQVDCRWRQQSRTVGRTNSAVMKNTQMMASGPMMNVNLPRWIGPAVTRWWVTVQCLLLSYQQVADALGTIAHALCRPGCPWLPQMRRVKCCACGICKSRTQKRLRKEQAAGMLHQGCAPGTKSFRPMVRRSMVGMT